MADPKSSHTPASLAPYRELTVAGTVLGVVLGVVMTAAFVYIALKLGFTLPGSTVAAILGFLVLRVIMKRGSIVENNINQTIASSINNASAGITFTLPALFLMSTTQPELGEFSVWPMMLAGVAGSFLGVVLIIPLRKQIIEFERLRFPSGIAVASLLKSPGAGARQAKLLVGGFLVSALFHSVAHFVDGMELIDIGAWFGVPSYFPIIIGMTFASFGAGMLSGKGGLPFVFGGILAWWIISPMVVQLDWLPAIAPPVRDLAPEGHTAWLSEDVVYLQMLRPLGIGVLIGGALSGVIASFPALKSAMKSLSAAAKTRVVGEASEEMSTRVIYVGMGASVLILFAAALFSTDTVTIGQAVGIAVVGTLWLAVAGLIVAQATGRTDISPLSGLALIGVTIMFFMTAGNVVASVMLGVAVCIGIGQCADMMSDLKSGHLIGATPRRQQIAQFATSWIGIPVAIGTLYLLWGPDGGGFGPGTDLSAPQAGALQAIIESLQAGDSAIDKFAAGSGIGLALGLFPLGGLGVLVGLAMYLPFDVTLSYGVGCIAAIALQHFKGARWIHQTMVPVAAGFIVGEALTSLTLVLISLATG